MLIVSGEIFPQCKLTLLILEREKISLPGLTQQMSTARYICSWKHKCYKRSYVQRKRITKAFLPTEVIYINILSIFKSEGK